MGHWHWTLLLNRLILSCFTAVYGVTRYHDDVTDRGLTSAVMSELIQLLAFIPFLSQDLWREWDNRLVASDGAPSFGFGVSEARCHPDVLRNIAAHVAVPPSQVRLTAMEGDAVPDETDEPVLQLDHTLDDFFPIISNVCRRPAHAATTEIVAASLAIRRLA